MLSPAVPFLQSALSGWHLLVHGTLSAMAHAPHPYRGSCYPAEVIQHAVWLYDSFSLSLRGVERPWSPAES